MKKSLVLMVLAGVLMLSGCSAHGVECPAIAYAYTVTIDASDASGIEVCMGGDCVVSTEPGVDADYSSEVPFTVSEQENGSFELLYQFSPPEILTISKLNDDGTTPSKPKTFDLESSSEPGVCGWGSASTDPITL